MDEALFDPLAWTRSNALIGEASGRGAAYFLQRDDGTQWVLRHSRRGGMVAQLSDDTYLWLGAARCRVFREWHLLAGMRNKGLPVPVPVAARAIRSHLIYRGDLITQRVPQAWPLSDWLGEQALSSDTWRRIGAVLARFHHAGVYHHDLNARNILLGRDGAVTLIDFDKSRWRTPGRWCRRNVERLRRSLDKFAGKQPVFNFNEANWQSLRAGYASRPPVE